MVVGITILAGGRTGNFGLTDVRDSVNYVFTREKPLIGIYGFSGEKFINGMGFITYDLGDECQKFNKVDPKAVDNDSQATDTLIPIDNIDNNSKVDPAVFEELEKDENDTGAIDDKEKVTNPNTSTTNRP